ncbi:hypothetical protein K7X08_015185 [Anisodus acutangulus]|uniref:Uncharacterized protein n=1 Tax=Anisodus acutangulus TaxID=402998 RepID=A0A9Q1L5C1_9SOLA|nr:hypothetical protein K7X08_015185 [Anisodus acutangulus]
MISVSGEGILEIGVISSTRKGKFAVELIRCAPEASSLLSATQHFSWFNLLCERKQEGEGRDRFELVHSTYFLIPL